MTVDLGDLVRGLAAHGDNLHRLSLLNIDDERQRVALRRTAEFVETHMPTARSYSGATPYEAKIALLEHAVDLAPADGLVLEFGVATGDTLRRITAKRSPSHGFDSFEGLPEDWRTGFAKGAFAMSPPDIPGATLHVGWFDDTLPGFFAENPGPIAFAHLDADLYSSTVTIFREGEDRFVEGSILLFDEYFNFPGWEHHEHKAFIEFIDRTGHDFEYLAYNALHEQVLVRLTS
ncbi:class I SAM-dependent methyltransferase [Blastococcus sp. TF02-8]|uniref:TylF/MycF/NovP-related O-methyltransferase n=1 Tax=Blastococcus sp. TF02-8 TaxID=2250574 RepID=UPI000DE9973F|nr:class I SAM-dependent methyltransferase [Blastococcus sp. TF02-8]RBY95201.1 class I SAM-dependent methyltransferase [Blastococcus sp. TF02-8]